MTKTHLNDPHDRLRRFGGQGLGRRQRGALFAAIVLGAEATSREIAGWTYPELTIYGRKPDRWQMMTQARALKSIGAVRIRKEGKEWVWKLPQPPLDVDLEPDDAVDQVYG